MTTFADSKQTRLFGVQFQAKSCEPQSEILTKTKRVGPVLESQHEVVSVAHDDYVATRVPFTPVLYPQIKNVVKIHIRKKWRDCRSLRCALLYG